MTIYRYVMPIKKMTKIMIACVAIVSFRFLELKTARKMGQNQNSRSLSFLGTSLQLNSKNNGPVLLFKTIIRHWNCFLFFVAMHGMDGYIRTETKKHYNAMPAKITSKINMFGASRWNLSYIFFVSLQENLRMGESTKQLTEITNILMT